MPPNLLTRTGSWDQCPKVTDLTTPPPSPSRSITVRSGTTAVVAFYRDGHVWVANAGDSRAVIGAEDVGAYTESWCEERGAPGLVGAALKHLSEFL